MFPPCLGGRRGSISGRGWEAINSRSEPCESGSRVGLNKEREVVLLDGLAGHSGSLDKEG